MNKKVISLIMSAAVMLGSISMPFADTEITAFADDSRVTPYVIDPEWYDEDDITEKEIDLYFLEDGIKKLGYSLPDDLPTKYVIPEWEDYVWSTSLLSSDLNLTDFKTGVMTVAEYQTKYVTKSGYESVYEQSCDVYGRSNDYKSMIHYKVNLHNYALTLRKQAAKQWVAENITSDMTTKQKVEAVVRKMTYGAYEGGVDAVLGTSSGDCIDYSIDSLFYFNEMGIPARVRFDGGLFGTSFTSNHHNVCVIIDGDVYIIDCTPWGNKTTEGYLSSLTANVKKVTGSTAGIMTDGKYSYWLLDDGTLELVDIINLTYELPEVWTIPESTVINGKTYKISKLGPINYLTTCYTDFPTVKEILVPSGITPDSNFSYVFSSHYFPNLKKLTLNDGLNSLDWLSVSTSTGGKPITVDATMTTIDTVNEDKDHFYYLLHLGGSTTLYTSVTDVLREAYEKDNGNSLNPWHLIDISNPDARKITFTAPKPDNGSLRLYIGKNKNPISPLSEKDGKYEFPYMVPGEYTVKYTINGEQKEYPIMLADEDIDLNLTENMFNYMPIGVYGNSYSIPAQTMDELSEQLKIVDEKGNEYLIAKEDYSYYFKVYGLPDGTYNIYAKLLGYTSNAFSVTIKDGKYESDGRPNIFVYKCGDLNNDSKINSSDLLAVKSHIKGIKELTGLDFLKADINGDNKINSTDLLLMKSHIKGIKKLW